jgi:hypothetical protein
MKNDKIEFLLSLDKSDLKRLLRTLIYRDIEIRINGEHRFTFYKSEYDSIKDKMEIKRRQLIRKEKIKNIHTNGKI